MRENIFSNSSNDDWISRTMKPLKSADTHDAGQSIGQAVIWGMKARTTPIEQLVLILLGSATRHLSDTKSLQA